MSEMAFARHLLRGAPHEKARLKRAANEHCFGVRASPNCRADAMRLHMHSRCHSRPLAVAQALLLETSWVFSLARRAGFQFATNNIGEGVGAAKLAADSGASWVDLNCGCPIHGTALHTSNAVCH